MESIHCPDEVPALSAIKVQQAFNQFFYPQVVSVLLIFLHFVHFTSRIMMTLSLNNTVQEQTLQLIFGFIAILL